MANCFRAFARTKRYFCLTVWFRIVEFTLGEALLMGKEWKMVKTLVDKDLIAWTISSYINHNFSAVLLLSDIVTTYQDWSGSIFPSVYAAILQRASAVSKPRGRDFDIEMQVNQYQWMVAKSNWMLLLMHTLLSHQLICQGRAYVRMPWTSHSQIFSITSSDERNCNKL